MVLQKKGREKSGTVKSSSASYDNVLFRTATANNMIIYIASAADKLYRTYSRYDLYTKYRKKVTDLI